MLPQESFLILHFSTLIFISSLTVLIELFGVSQKLMHFKLYYQRYACQLILNISTEEHHPALQLLHKKPQLVEMLKSAGKNGQSCDLYVISYIILFSLDLLDASIGGL